jgi:anti-anti-sigma factor
VSAQFNVRLEPQSTPDVTILTLEGELDLVAAPTLHEELHNTLQTGAQQLVLDLGAVSFMDSSGLRTLLTAHEESLEKGVSFVLRRVPSTVQRLFEITGVTDELDIEPG